MLKKVFLPAAVLLILYSAAVSAQTDSAKIVFTGNLLTDSKNISENYQPGNVSVPLQVKEKRSPLLAGLMSLIVPGAGEVYNDDYWKAGAFVALEATLIVVGLHYDHKGDTQTDKFQNYADGSWSVVKYAQWINTHRGGTISINPDENLPPWERVNLSELNEAERKNGFSHSLPRHGEQQYYEMIGKYPQFSGGWDDFSSADPDYHDVSAHFLSYSQMRGKANDYYNVAAKAVIGIYINHFLSTLDAVWSAISYNKKLSVSMRVNNIQNGYSTEFAPAVNFKYNF